MMSEVAEAVTRLFSCHGMDIGPLPALLSPSGMCKLVGGAKGSRVPRSLSPSGMCDRVESWEDGRDGR